MTSRTESKHTPGPWVARDTRDYAEIVGPKGDGVIAMVAKRDDADRIVSCINALEGIEDPATLRAERDALRAACSHALATILEICCDEESDLTAELRAALSPREWK